MVQISHLIRIGAPRGAVFRHIATAEGIALWFTRASASRYEAGGTLELTFPENDRVRFEVLDVTPPQRVAWRCISAESAWYETEVVFALEGLGDTTVVRFDHLGWTTVDDRFRDCSMSWAYFLESLRSLSEDGEGTPEIFAD